MKLRGIIRWLLAGSCGLLASCAIITVNVYFPEKDVKQAYKSLDEMLLQQESTGAPPPPAEAPPEKKGEELKPQSRLPFSLSLVPEACAAETVADDLAIEISSDSEVLRAYDLMRARLHQLDSLRQNGIVGETNQGLVTIRDKARGAGSEALVKAENDNRKTVITAMARAILKINRQDTKKIPGKILGKAAAMYADAKKDAARPGWWVQLPNGSWVKK